MNEQSGSQDTSLNWVFHAKKQIGPSYCSKHYLNISYKWIWNIFIPICEKHIIQGKKKKKFGELRYCAMNYVFSETG